MHESTKGSEAVLALAESVGGQTRLAELLGVNQSTISGWARGKIRPDGANLTALLELLTSRGIAVVADDFLDREETRSLAQKRQRIRRHVRASGTEG